MKENIYLDQSKAFRPVEAKDAEFINEVRNASREWLHDNSYYTIDNTKEWIKDCAWWIVEYNQEPVGYFRISEFDRQMYLGMDLHPKHRGKGIAYEAYQLFISKLFTNESLNKISLEVLSHNHIAISLYEKIGFVKEGVKRQEVYRNGEWLDSIIMSILREEWER